MTTKAKMPKISAPARPGVASGVAPGAVRHWNSELAPAALAADEAEISISVLEPIGDDGWGEGVTVRRIAAALRQIGPRDVIVNINSPGGDFFEGLAIYNALREHPGRVEVRILGIAASAASIIAMAGDEVKIARAGFVMIHNTWVMAAGDQNALRDVADWLEPFDQAARAIYAARTGLDQAEIKAMLNKETWITGEAALAQGFCDALLPADALDGERARAAAALTPQAAKRKLELLLAGRASRSERRELIAALDIGGKPGAAPPSGMSRAAVSELAQSALAKLQSL